jgi:glutathione S-transferase
MKLYYFETVNPRKACATAKYLGLSVNFVRLDVGKGEHKSAEHLARNPNGKVPVLVDGDVLLWESMAIMLYLAGKADSPLWPANDPARQAEVLRWMSWDAFHFLPRAGAFYFQHHIKALFGMGKPDQAVLDAATPGFHESAKILNDRLAQTKFVTGDTLTIADFCLAPTLPHAEEIHLPWEPYRNIRRWHDDLMAIDAWANPWPEPE